MISPRHEEARKVAAIVRQQLKAQGAIGVEDHAVTVLRRLDLGREACLYLYTMRLAELSDSIRALREDLSPAKSGPSGKRIARL